VRQRCEGLDEGGLVLDRHEPADSADDKVGGGGAADSCRRSEAARVNSIMDGHRLVPEESPVAKQPALKVPNQYLLRVASSPKTMLLAYLPFYLRLVALVGLILALARPQTGDTHSEQKRDGLDLMLIVDTSVSMEALDFIIGSKRYSRIEASKEVLRNFIASRIDDRIGLTVFGDTAFAYTPFTLDHDVLLRFLNEIVSGMAGERTAIGDAIGITVNRFKDIEAKNKVAILLTDGENTAGKVDPLEAAKAAQVFGVKIYTIAIGSDKPAPIQTPVGMQYMRFNTDEKLLKAIADATGGAFFKAEDTNTLKEIYATIDRLEKTKVKTKTYRLFDEHFSWFVVFALLCLTLEWLWPLSRFRLVI
jgi:Ca-activated chloride channel family protein